MLALDDEDVPLSAEMSKIFHTTTAKLLYLCKRARPDVQLPVLFMCTRVREPTVIDKRKLDRILGYLSKTLHRRRRICSVVGALKLHCYIDASFATHPNGKGHMGVVIMWGNTSIVIVCQKQKIATKDSTESETVGLSDKYKVLEWTQDFILGLKVKLQKPVIFQDNTSTITIIKDKGGKRLRTKHLTARKAVLHEAIVENQECDLVYKNTKVMVADPFTKALEGASF